MKRNFFPVLGCILFLSLIPSTRCKGQYKNDQPGQSFIAEGRPTPSNNPTFLLENPEHISLFVRRVFQDKKGNLWLGTNGDGVARYDGKSLLYFTTIEGLSGNAVRGIIEDENGNTWFATNGGISRYDGKTFTNLYLPGGRLNNATWCILKDKAGNLWTGTEGGLFRYDAILRIFTSIPLPVPDIKDALGAYQAPKLINCIMEDRAGTLWFGSNGGGAYCYDGKSFINISEKDGLANNFVQCIIEDKTGNLWFSTRFGGVSQYDGKSFTNFTMKDGLSSNFVWTLLEERSGKIWFSLTGEGLARYDGNSFTSFTEKDGLKVTHVQSIFEDRNGKIWLGASGGLFRYDGNSPANGHKGFVTVTRNGPWK
jgi:ligand-binding sensor domain-containing protein